MFKCCCVAVLALMMCACGPRAGRPSPPQRSNTSPAGPRPPAAVRYRIDPAHSELRLLIYRGGPMAAFGHNHVIVNRALAGSVDFAGSPAASSFSVTVPVAGFVVDEAPARREEGADFPGDLSDDAKSGTLRNMQSAALLDAAHFPVISVASAKVSDANGALEATLTIAVAGHRSTIIAPFAVDVMAGRLAATGTFELRQSALGLAPFSIMLGALSVEDRMRVKFKITALAP